MRIVSWNILSNEFIRKKDYPMINSKILFNRQQRLENIMRILIHLNGDIILLQEVMQPEYNILYKFFNNNYHIVRGENITWYGKKSYSGNVIFLRKNIFFASSNSKNTDFLQANIDFGLYVKCYVNKKPLMILNVHLDDTTHKKRVSEIKSISDQLNEPQVILGGDFNQNYNKESQLYKLLEKAGFKSLIHEPTYYIDKKICIDNIMTKGFNNEYQSQVINNFGDDIFKQFTAYGSDHLPIVVDTILK